MKSFCLLACLVGSCLLLPTPAFAQKEVLYQSIQSRADASWEMAQKIWGWAETGYQEKRSAALLADALESAGFKVERGVAQMPTAFTATIGSGKPVIGILGEYDALPQLSQAAVPFRQVRPESSNGHGCGHHLFGVACASASIALGEQITAGKIKGTLRYYGCPAEEGGSAKAFMVRAGLFNDCDAVLHWHPADRNGAGGGSCLAMKSVKFRFYGASAHAAGAPDQGRSALDGVELTNHAVQLLREHMPESSRVHHVITSGGGAPNVVPDFAEVYYYIRHPSSETLRKLYARLLKCAEAGALATETRLEIIPVGGELEVLPNDPLDAIVKANLTKLNDLRYTEEDQKFAARLQSTLANSPALDIISKVEEVPANFVRKGSTDVGDVSWAAPTAGFAAACWVPGTPGHSWQATAAGGTNIGRLGMHLAARVLVASAWDFFHDPKVLTAAKAEHQRRLAGRKYQPLVDPDRPPPLDYREPPKRK